MLIRGNVVDLSTEEGPDDLFLSLLLESCKVIAPVVVEDREDVALVGLV